LIHHFDPFYCCSEFKQDQREYTVTVPQSISTAKLTATSSKPDHSTISLIEGSATRSMTSDVEMGDLGLGFGKNVKKIRFQCDKTSPQEYTITFVRQGECLF
jgi:hypothetical protein